MTLTFPTDNPVLIVAVATTAFLVAPLISKRLNVPSIIVLILMGAAVSENALGLLRRDQALELLGNVGLLYLLFIAGLEIDLQGFAQHKGRSIVFGGISFGLPLALALLVMPRVGYGWAATFLVGAIVASHTLLAYPIVSRLGVTKDAASTTVVGGTLLTDTLSLGLLAVVSSVAEGGDGPGTLLVLLGTLTLYTTLVVWGLPKLGRWFFRNTDSEAGLRYLFLIAVMFTSAFLAELAGAQPIIGAFLAGLTLNRLVPKQSTMMTRVTFFGDAFFIPFFLLSVGLLLDFRVIVGGPEVALLAALLCAMVFVGKGGAALISQRIFGFSNAQGLMMAGLSIPQAAATLAVTFVGLEIGLFGEEVVNAVIALILVSTLLGASLVERYGRKVATAVGDARAGLGSAPQRILVPLSNPVTAETLMDVAFLLRDQHSQESVFPLTVVPEGSDPEDDVAEAERLLAHAIVHAAETEVPVNPITRVAANSASGISDAAAERRVSTIVIGWNGARSARRRIFGGVIDQTLESTRQQLLVCKLKDPLNTFTRIVAILPPLIDYNPGFYDALDTLKNLTERLGTELLIMAVQGNTERFEIRLKEVGLTSEVAFVGITGWNALSDALAATLEDNDLVVLMSARRGTVAHTGALERLPRDLTDRGANFIVLYPSERELRRTSLRRGNLPDILARERVLLNLTTPDYRSTVDALLCTTIAKHDRRHNSVLRALVYDDIGFATEVLPGVLLPHARVRELKETVMLLCTHRYGVRHERASQQVHVVALLLSPAELSPHDHLAHLSAVAQHFSRAAYLGELVQASNLEQVEAWFAQQTTTAVRQREAVAAD